MCHGGLEFSFREWRHGPDNRLEQPYSMKTDMSNYTHQTAPTQFLEANGVRLPIAALGSRKGCRWSSFHIFSVISTAGILL
jgi:hypothetical protein